MQVYSEQGARTQGRSNRGLEQSGKYRRLLCKIRSWQDKCKWEPRRWVLCLEPEILPVSRASAWDFCLCKYTVDPTIVVSFAAPAWGERLAPASLQTATKVSTSEIRFRSCKHFFTNINDAVGTFFYVCFPIVDKTHSKWLPNEFTKENEVSMVSTPIILVSMHT